jgi:uncharacterized membrane protein YcaP (DUF421 family)
MDIVIRAAVAYLFIVVLMRVVGRRELSSLAPTDIVLLVVLGDLIQSGVTQSDMSITGMILAASTFGIMATVTSMLVYHSRRAAKIIEGQPLILVDNGKPVGSNLRSQRITIDDVMEEARAQQIERLEEIKWAVLETSGTISFIKTS